MSIIKNSNIGDCWQECNMSIVYVDTGEAEDKNKISECWDHVCGCWPALPPSHYSVTQQWNLLVLSTSVQDCWRLLFFVCLFCCFSVCFFRLKIVPRRADMIIFESHYTPLTLRLVFTESEDWLGYSDLLQSMKWLENGLYSLHLAWKGLKMATLKIFLPYSQFIPMELHILIDTYFAAQTYGLCTVCPSMEHCVQVHSTQWGESLVVKVVYLI